MSLSSRPAVDPEADFHLVLNLHRAHHHAERRKAEVGVPQRKLASCGKTLRRRLEVHRCHHFRGAVAHRDLHMDLQFVGRSHVHLPRSQQNLGKMLTIQECRAKHVAAGAPTRGIRHFRGEVGAFLRAQRGFIDGQLVHWNTQLEGGMRQVGRHIGRTGQIVRSNKVVVTGPGQRAAAVHPYGQEGFS